jgi:hypothetical protein
MRRRIVNPMQGQYGLNLRVQMCTERHANPRDDSENKQRCPVCDRHVDNVPLCVGDHYDLPV